MFQLFKLQVGIKALYQRQKLRRAIHSLKKEEEESKSSLANQTSDIESSGLSGRPEELYKQLSDRELLLQAGGFGQEITAANDQSFLDQFVIPSQLGFLRKLAAFKVLLHTTFVRSGSRHSTSGSVISSSEVDQLPKKVKDADELFITDLISQIDDNEEYLMLSEYLELGKSSEDVSTDLHDELTEVLSFMTSEE